MNITKQPKQPRNHEVGGVYRDEKVGGLWLVISLPRGEVAFVDLDTCIAPSWLRYSSLEMMDRDNPDDTPVSAELVIGE